MLYNTYRERYLKYFSILFPYIILFSISAAFLWAFASGMFNYAVTGFVMAVPAIISCYYIINVKKEEVDFKKSISFFVLENKTFSYYLFIYIYYISIIFLLFHGSRPWYYFLFMSIAYLVVFLQIFSRNPDYRIVLIEIFFLMLNLSYSVTFTYALYFGTTDLLPHIFISQVTYLSGHIIPSSLSRYAYFPIYHILIAEASYLLNLNIKTSLFLITAPIYGLTVFFIYYILLKVINNRQIVLLPCALYSLIPVVIYYGVNVITRTMAFFWFILILYLAYSDSWEKNKIMFRLLSLFLSLVLILTHHVSMFHIILVITILFISEWLTGNKKFITFNYYVLLNVSFLSYWFFVAVPFVQRDLATPLQFSFWDSPTLLPENPGIVQSQYITALGLVDDSIFLFFALIGIGYFLKYHNKYASVFGLLALFTLIFYIPNPINTIWQLVVLFSISRMALFVAPFMAFVMGVGIYLYLTKIPPAHGKFLKRKLFAVILILFIFVFFSLVYSVFDSEDLLVNSRHEYFNEQELNSFNYICKRVPFGADIYSDDSTTRYFPAKFNGSEALCLPYYNAKEILSVDTLSEAKGYLIIRNQEFLKIGLYFGTEDLNVRGVPKYLYTSTSKNQNELYSKVAKKDKVYSNSAVTLYYS